MSKYLRKKWAVLNTVQATSGDRTNSGGMYYITGLNPFPTKDGVAIETKVLKPAEMDAAASNGGTGATSTITISSQAYVKYECYKFVYNGLNYYGVNTSTSGTGTTVVVAWVGPNGNPGAVTGSLNRIGWGAIEVDFANPSVTGTLQLGVSFAANYGETSTSGSPMQSITFSNTTDSGGTPTAATLATNFYGELFPYLNTSGYLMGINSDKVYIAIPSNKGSIIKVSEATVSGFETGTVISSLVPVAPSGTSGGVMTTATVLVNYGADLIAQGYPAATGTATNDGFISTAVYGQVDIDISSPTFAGAIENYSQTLYVNLTSEQSDGNTLIASILSDLN